MSHDNITDITTYLRAHAIELGERILETYPPLQSTKDPVAPVSYTHLLGDRVPLRLMRENEIDEVAPAILSAVRAFLCNK